MARIYSVAFISSTGEDAELDYNVPEGMVAIVRQVSVVQSDEAYDFGLYVGGMTDGDGTQIIAIPSAGAYNTVAEQGRWVSPAGTVIRGYVNTKTANLAVYVGGYLLSA